MFRKKKILIASDHAGYELKKYLKKYLTSKKYNIIDCGTTNKEESVDYPDYANALAGLIKLNKAAKGVLICGTGIGMSIAANRHKSIRAALCTNEKMASLAREHNDANVLVLGSRITSEETNKKILDAFLSAKFSKGRHLKRIKKL